MQTLKKDRIKKLVKVKITIIEFGAFELKKAILLDEIDIAVLLDPIDLQDVDTKVLISDELQLFMSKNHPLTNKETIFWSDLKSQEIALFNETFMIHHLIKHAFTKHGIRPQIKITSSSWNYLLRSTLQTDLVTFLPKPTYNITDTEMFVAKSLSEPVLWTVNLVRKKKRTYRKVEAHFYQTTNEHFQKMQEL